MENVKSLAQRLKITNKELLALTKEAGLQQTKVADEISVEDNKVILEYLKKKRDAEQTQKPKILSLNRAFAAPTGSGSGKISVLHKRKKVSASNRSVDELNALHEREKELSGLAADKKRQLAEEDIEKKKSLEQEQRMEKEHLEEQKRQEETTKKDAEPTATPAPAATPTPDPAATPTSSTIRKAKTPPVSAPSRVAHKAPIKKPAEPERSRPVGAKRQRTGIKQTTLATPVDSVQLNELARGKRAGRNFERETLTSNILKQGFQKPATAKTKDILIGDSIQVAELAHMLGIKAAVLVKALMKLGFMATINQSIDNDTAVLVAEELGHKVGKEETVDMEQQVSVDARSYQNKPRPPVVTVMGHVDHGKTSLLDYIRRTKVVEKESGGITQHIGAYHVATDKGNISFLDTPGHAAFTSMRARGALLTDIVILVVACDDKVMPQTIEAIDHAKSAKVPVVVALNKVDRDEADPERLTNELSAYELVPEEWGGDVPFIKISALNGDGVDALLDAVSLQAELLELSAPDEGPAKGTVIESRLDKHRGAIASVLVRQGTLKKGDQILVGSTIGRVRAMYNELGQLQDTATPSIPVEILGLSEVPEAGDELAVITDDKAAKELADTRLHERKNAQIASPVMSIEDAFNNIGNNQKELNVIIKADTRGSLEAIKYSLSELETEEMKVNLVMSGTGGIAETDISLAQATEAKVFGFHVRADSNARQIAEKSNVKISYYSVIYELIDDIDNFLNGLLDPLFEENILGTAEVRDIFSASRFGEIAGSMVVDGSIFRNKPIRVIRNNTVIYEGELESLRRFKEDVAQVRSGTECGIGVKGYKDIRVGDRIEVFDRVEVERKKSQRSKHAV